MVNHYAPPLDISAACSPGALDVGMTAFYGDVYFTRFGVVSPLLTAAGLRDFCRGGISPWFVWFSAFCVHALDSSAALRFRCRAACTGR